MIDYLLSIVKYYVKIKLGFTNVTLKLQIALSSNCPWISWRKLTERLEIFIVHSFLLDFTEI